MPEHGERGCADADREVPAPIGAPERTVDDRERRGQPFAAAGGARSEEAGSLEHDADLIALGLR
jgi:hypothetical protein